MQRLIDFLDMLRRFGQKLGPYLMIEILLPGGSLLALMLFLYQRRKAGTGRTMPRPVAVVMSVWASFLPQNIFMAQPCFVRSSRALRSAVDSRE